MQTHGSEEPPPLCRVCPPEIHHKVALWPPFWPGAGASWDVSAAAEGERALPVGGLPAPQCIHCSPEFPR